MWDEAGLIENGRLVIGTITVERWHPPGELGLLWAASPDPVSRELRAWASDRAGEPHSMNDLLLVDIPGRGEVARPRTALVHDPRSYPEEGAELAAEELVPGLWVRTPDNFAARTTRHDGRVKLLLSSRMRTTMLPEVLGSTFIVIGHLRECEGRQAEVA